MNEVSRVAQAALDREPELDLLESRVRESLEQARRAGASEAEASAHSSLGLSVNVRLGEVETLEHMRDRGINLTVFIGRRKGEASSADLRPESISQCVEKAVDIARFTQEDSCNGLAPAELLATEFPDFDLWHPEPMDVERAIARALRCESAGRADSRITNSEGASFNAASGLSVYGNTHGFLGRSSGTSYSQSCVLLAGKGEGMQRDYSYDSRRCLRDLEAAEETGREAARRTIGRLGSQRIKTAEMPVLFSPRVAKSLVGHLLSAIAGSTLYRKASFLRDQAGQALFPGWATLRERPHLRRGASSAAFDGDGVSTRERLIVEQGVLTGYLLSCYSARRLGLESTGNAGGARNLLFEPGGDGCEQPLEALADGFYVTEVMGQGVRLVTGDYSRGAAGFRVVNGELRHAVEEVTIAGNLRDMFAGLLLAGADVDTRGNIHCGSLLIDRMVVAGA